MESTNQQNNKIPSGQPAKKNNFWKWLAILSFGLLLFVLIFDVDINPRFNLGGKTSEVEVPSSGSGDKETAGLEENVLPSGGITLPVVWGDLGKQMIAAGVIDADKFESLYERRGGLDDSAKDLLYGANNGSLTIDEQNAGFVLNLLWAFGIGNKNPILEEGPMKDPKYGGDASRFASTGGWSLANGKAMDHYGRYEFATLTQNQQELVEKVSKNIYRPCCGNSTYFPDCNHGMAMLGLLELMASQGVSEEEMYKTALQVNSYWFPDTYLTIAKYFQKREVAWKDVNAKEVLGSLYSSSAGYRQILTEVEPPQRRGGGGCGV